MDNPIIYYSLETVMFFDKPYYDGTQWHNLSSNQGDRRVFLTETRSAMMGFPIEQNESPAAYVYSIYGIGDECFTPVYDRTREISDEKRLYPHELVMI